MSHGAARCNDIQIEPTRRPCPVDAPVVFSDFPTRPRLPWIGGEPMPGDDPVVRDFIYLDYSRVTSLAAQLGVSEDRGAAAPSPAVPNLVARERTFFALEAVLVGRGATQIDALFDVASWTPDAFSDG